SLRERPAAAGATSPGAGSCERRVPTTTGCPRPHRGPPRSAPPQAERSPAARPGPLTLAPARCTPRHRPRGSRPRSVADPPAVLDRLGEMDRLDGLGAGEVGD